MRFALNGSTGLLGRNLLFEIIKRYIKNLDNVEIIILGRNGNNKTLENRIKKIILNDGSDYLNIDINNKNKFLEIFSRLKFIDFDLTLSDLGIQPYDLEYLKKTKIDYFYHIAALTNFMNTPAVEKKLYKINFEGTKNILELISQLNVENVLYVGTVYHANVNGLEIIPTYINNTKKFRNPYEKTKLAAEKYFIRFSKDNHINYKVCRTSTISGRLIEQKLGSVSKYDVFYEWAKFFLRYKIKKLNTSNNPFYKQYETNIRIKMHPQSIMNIVPADYAAKLIYLISIENTAENAFHIVNDKDISSKIMTKIIMKKLNISGYSFVSREPDNKDILEKLYYRTVGNIFTPYIIDPPINYNNDNIKDIIKRYNLKCPLMTENNFEILIDWAVKKKFGLSY